MKVLRAFDRGLARAEGFALVVFVGAMVGVSFLQVILRNLFHTGIEGADVLLRHGVLWVALLGASLATRQARHIRIDIVSRLIPAAHQAWIERITGLAAFAVSVSLTGEGWTLVRLEREARTVLAPGIPTWVAQVIIPLGFLLIAFRLGLMTLENIRTPKAEGDETP